MFEAYTEKARRIIFFGRYSASQLGSPYIEPEHLLLGILREDKALTNRFLTSLSSVESIRQQIESHGPIREKVHVEIPLSNESKRVLSWAKEEASRLSDKHIRPEHLLLGLLRDDKSFAAEILRQRGLELSVVRLELAKTAPNRSSPLPELLRETSRDLTQMARDNKFDPLVGREDELQGVIEVLGSRNNRNPLLIGERGVGKSKIVEALAQRIADGEVPSFLEGKRVLAFDLLDQTRDRVKFDEGLLAMVKELVSTSGVIMFIEELLPLVGANATSGPVNAAEFLKAALLRGEIQCISTCTASDYEQSIEFLPWLVRCFRTIKVLPLDEESTIRLLSGHKGEYEKFHEVGYLDEAIQYAVHYAVRYFPDSVPFGKALEILDAAGSHAKLRQTSLPEEIIEVQKRIKFIVHRMENTIANQEFEKARFYSDEERKEREKLGTLREKYHLDDSSPGIVDREDVENVISRWTGVRISSIREEDTDKESIPAMQSVAVTLSPITPQSPSLHVFLCHSSTDKPAVRDLYRRLKENRIDPWLDQENLIPGQDWELEISKAVSSSHVVIVCLSAHAANRAGYLHKEIKKVLDVADKQPEGTIFVIPVKLEECDVPDRLLRWHWVNLFESNGFEKLMRALLERARSLGMGLQ